jgi:NitT/TauT family transport system substrate-binding protein
VTAEAHQAAKENPEKAVDLLIKHLPQQARNKALLLRQLNLTLPTLETRSTKGKGFGVMSEDDWRRTQDLLLKFGGLGKQVPLDKLYTNQFLET